MKSVITSKYQTTIPKSIRMQLKLSISDALEWKVQNGKAVVSPIRSKFLEHRNAIKIGAGIITKDIDMARKERAGKFK
jgi:bifunctional DNA-binding transcriptional regulator/antitoxin component of YhaV-PrlF toxin-antitoxin module